MLTINYECISANYLPGFTWYVVVQCCHAWPCSLVFKACGTQHDSLLNVDVYFDPVD